MRKFVGLLLATTLMACSPDEGATNPHLIPDGQCVTENHDYCRTSQALLEFSSSPGCGLLPATLNVQIPEDITHGTCLLSTFWEEDNTLIVKDNCPTGQQLFCVGKIGEEGRCWWTATGSEICPFTMTIKPKE